MIKTIDTFSDYLSLLDKGHYSVSENIDLWETYIKKTPELEKKIKEDYEQANIDWFEFAKEKVFNHHNEDFKYMLLAYQHLQIATEKVLKRAQGLYGLDFDINIVYYRGLCNSAGWVDYYDGQVAILLGLDKIAELRWHSLEKLETLVAHELCHAIHFNYGGFKIIDPDFTDDLYDQGIWRLFEEGVATHFQSSLTDHAEDKRGKEWRNKCQQIEAKLKSAYVEALKDPELGTRNFYGDWYKVYDISDTGYYLGSVLIEYLNKNRDFKAIAKMDKASIVDAVRTYLES